jgi:hypothetical protein
MIVGDHARSRITDGKASGCFGDRKGMNFVSPDTPPISPLSGPLFQERYSKSHVIGKEEKRGRRRTHVGYLSLRGKITYERVIEAYSGHSVEV